MKTPIWTKLSAKAALAAISLFSAATAALAQNFTTYDLIVPVNPTSTPVTVDGAGRVLPTNRSFVIGLDGGTRGSVTIQNFVASAVYPLVIVNRHGTGKVVITDVGGGTIRDDLTIKNCKYFQLRGDNDPAYRYGIELAQNGTKSLHTKLGLSVTGTSSNGEVMFVEAHDNGFAGFMVKSDPSCSDPSTWMGNFTMYDIRIHDNYVHNTGGEGMYLGYTHWGEIKDCSAQGSPVVYGHEIHGLYVHHNLVEHAGWENLQVASCPVDVKVFNNTLYDGGVTPDTVNFQGAGMAIGGGSTGEYFNNTIIKSYYPSIGVFGQESAVTVYNNLLADAGDYAIYAKNLPTNPPADPNAPFQTVPGSFCSFYNNTVVIPATSRGAYATEDEVSVNHVKNNIFVAGNTSYPYISLIQGLGPTAPGPVDAANNITQRDNSNINFVNVAERDYRILPTSNAVDAGTSLASLPSNEVSVTTDAEGHPRPTGASFDVGFHESGALSLFLVVTPPTTVGGTGTIKASAIGGTSPYTYLWSNAATTQTITTTAGLYTVIVTDAVGAQVKKGTYMNDLATMGAPISDMVELNQVLTPAISPAAGVYSTDQSVSLTTGTTGATIRYTVDGSIPSTTNGFVYTGAFTIQTTKTVRAIATKTGLTDSFVSAAAYQIDPINTKFTLVDANITESSHVASNTKAKSVDGSTGTQWQAISPITYLPSASSWTKSTVAGAYNNDTHSSALTDAAFTVVLNNGTQIAWYGATGPANGIAAVSIDGGAETLVDTYSAADAQNQLLYTSAVLPQDGHTLKVRVTGTKNASSTGTTIVADRFTTVSGTSPTYNDDQDRAWIRYDLGSNQRVALLRLAFGTGDKSNFRFEIQVSTDDVNYTSLVDGRYPGEPTWFVGSRDLAIQDYDIPDVEPVRYVRLVGHGNNNNNVNLQPNNNYAEVEIWGGALGSVPSITTQPQPQTVAPGASVAFSVVASASPAPTYRWDKDGVDIPGATLSSLTLTNVQPGDAGNYSVIVTNSAGTITSSSAALTVGVPPLGLILEAENATLVGALAKNNIAGYSGTGFADYINASGDYVEWTFTNPAAATRTLGFRYGSTGSARNLSITVNGVVVNPALAFTSTGTLTNWTILSMTASLPAGTVVIRATATGTSGPNIDYLRID